MTEEREAPDQAIKGTATEHWDLGAELSSNRCSTHILFFAGAMLLMLWPPAACLPSLGICGNRGSSRSAEKLGHAAIEKSLCNYVCYAVQLPGNKKGFSRAIYLIYGPHGPAPVLYMINGHILNKCLRSKARTTRADSSGTCCSPLLCCCSLPSIHPLNPSPDPPLLPPIC
ncbi:hypothetical protein BX070DRAFT_64272 [Coemansia spiralis]|nr:hypothetical protein BX070DRAFT_64272 [Coemansia spiralis]